MSLFDRLAHSLAYRLEYRAKRYVDRCKRKQMIRDLGLDCSIDLSVPELHAAIILAKYRHRISNLVDVGANRGRFTRTLDAVCELKRIVCVEPDATLHPQLRTAIPQHARVLSEAVSAAEGIATFNIHPDRSMNSLVGVGSEFNRLNPYYSTDRIEQCQVKTRSLDSLQEELGGSAGRDTLLKIDVQGHEMAVLRSGEQFLSRVAVLVTEYTFWQGYAKDYDFRQMLNWLAERGFVVKDVIDVNYRGASTAYADFVFTSDETSENVD